VVRPIPARGLPLDERSGVGAYAPASNDAVKVKAVSRKPMSRPKGALALQGGEEVG